jgi:D-beta-D-heptose 7-phosphate kinase/D-beta-D-heptose 1-phosphate adenosyltransferase
MQKMTTIHHWRFEKILTLENAARQAVECKKAGKRLVSLNGSFDILHGGHLDMLEEARMQGGVLFVGINSDRSIASGKGKGRPYIPEQERSALLAALVCVDYVVVVDAPYNEMAQTFVAALAPDVHVNGAEYGAPQTWLEWEAMQKVGAQGYSVPRREGLSTSDIVRKIRGTAS